ncbi:2-succinyl-5-enolpyruvyl-6-hydroxy-3-cyclohexene-1-carboxylic-acid synthase [Cellulomonas pakistanensis]|uniref:2-succinyl-5-enolpyruvyl-6-hydroxy-3-cyclohexene-1-carboxylate synthase n=1 Tax=Cellulomonas pakistanensis TaxID=992287 RepID=A0A919P810_9CELL|nr:2-succinyl-5-enolpyruvyl-6-hydroxy-3-cyclohexene-1-carboxylic-acid synthase [Cellulomonas pakistanensis]GIG36045.1 2-succinyl-5-enolpyruvyl-6-hydroxy-3-cyclohexene- 1-carboxylate synthase [Cellulomonas pakistanensis]
MTAGDGAVGPDAAPAPAPGPRGPVRGAPAAQAARLLVQELAAHGVRDVVLAPGSRSAPLAYALAEAALPDAERPAGAPAVRLHVRVDERSAAFLALGLARAAAAEDAPRAVAVVTTSGTAVANLHPAVLEAHHAGAPLLLLTADRPHELRGTGANQTTVQPGLFGPATRLEADVPAPSGRPGEDRDLRHLVSRAVAAALGARTGDPGPVHLDLAYREPLVPGPEPWPAPGAGGRVDVLARTSTDPAGGAGVPARADLPGPVVVVAGDGAGPDARRLAEAAGWPLLAEPSSGARGGRNALGTYRVLLGDPALGGRVRSVVLLGRPTLSRPVSALLARDDVDLTVVAPAGSGWPDAGRAADRVLPALPAAWLDGPADDPAWLDAWRRADAAASAAVDAELDDDPAAPPTRATPPLTGPRAVRSVAEASLPGDVLVVGSSNPVRDLDLVARWAEPPLVLANRGLAGIDGMLSTAAGVALGLPRRRVRALVGDLTFLHDVGGLLRLTTEPEVDLQVVVLNDAGGSIFATLEHGAPERARTFERVFGTPHAVDVAALCAGFGVRHVRVSDETALAAALAAPGRGTSVVEVRVDRVDRRALGERLTAAARDAARGALGDPADRG